MKLSQETLTITGMHCSSCSDRVSKVLSELQGVRSVNVSLEDQQATIQFDRDQTGINQMKETIKKAGYQAKKQ